MEKDLKESLKELPSRTGRHYYQRCEMHTTAATAILSEVETKQFSSLTGYCHAELHTVIHLAPHC
jgi:hypothetical protein